MPLFDMTVAGQRSTGFICGRGLKPCYLCGYVADYQCDYFVRPPSKARCNRHVCERHRTNLARNKDACPEHAPICLAAIERRAARAGA